MYRFVKKKIQKSSILYSLLLVISYYCCRTADTKNEAFVVVLKPTTNLKHFRLDNDFYL